MNTIDHQTKCDLVFLRIRGSILDGELMPGATVPILNLSKMFGVSMAPVREALRRLEAEGLIETSPHKTARVKPVSVPDIREIFLIRSRLEGLAALMALQNRSPELLERLRPWLAVMDENLKNGDGVEFGHANRAFHLALYEAAAPRLHAQLRHLFDQTQRYRVIFKLAPERMPESQRDHHRIYAHLDGGQEKSGISDIERFVREHVWAAATILMARINADMSHVPGP